MKIIILIYFLALSATFFGQEASDYELHLDIKNQESCDSVKILNVLFTNYSNKDVIIDNPEFYLRKSTFGVFFWFPIKWDILIMHEGSEQCYPEKRFIRISTDLENDTKLIKAHRTLSFNIPINTKRMNCMNDPDLKGNRFRKGRFTIRLILQLIHPKDIELKSNIVEFELK
ncbi:hypothetical protein [Dysgonomonas sp. ZJ709]|uniref:hypothetical protein n=1 Tax=Dysgonomonas sp. ZJ709 TaxID=2709797 RepID=UPI0013ED47E3|nr:hypothetical protein [Dysgonomonas sp. ZJ709]